MNNLPTHYKNQSGSALIVSLSILLVLTILGISSLRTTSLEEKMAGNSRDAQTAFEAAEAALREAELFIANSINDDAYTNTGGPGGLFNFAGTVIAADAWTVENNWNNSSVSVDYNLNQVAQLPRYMIQKIQSQVGLGGASDLGNSYSYGETVTEDYYQISARGTGISPNSRVMLQTFFKW